MKLKKFIQFEKYESPVDDHSDYDDDYGDYGDYDEVVDDENSDIQNLMDLLRSFFENQGIEVKVENKGFDLNIYTFLNKIDKLKNIIKIFNIVKRVKKDILPQYDSEFELYESEDGSPVLYFSFYYDEGLGDDNAF